MNYYIGVDPAMISIGITVVRVNEEGMSQIYFHNCSITEFGSVLNAYQIGKKDKVWLFMEKCVKRWGRFKIVKSAAASIERHIKKHYPHRNKVFKYTPAQWRKILFGKASDSDNKGVSMKYVADRGYNVANDDVAESYCVLVAGLKDQGMEDVLNDTVGKN